MATWARVRNLGRLDHFSFGDVFGALRRKMFSPAAKGWRVGRNGVRILTISGAKQVPIRHVGRGRGWQRMTMHPLSGKAPLAAPKLHPCRRVHGFTCGIPQLVHFVLMRTNVLDSTQYHPEHVQKCTRRSIGGPGMGEWYSGGGRARAGQAMHHRKGTNAPNSSRKHA